MSSSLQSGPVAQLGARVNGIHEVTGSIPVWSTILRSRELPPKRELRPASQAKDVSPKPRSGKGGPALISPPRLMATKALQIFQHTALSETANVATAGRASLIFQGSRAG